MVIQHDHGYADQVVTSTSAINAGGAPKDAEWYGINTHWTYDVLDDLAAGVRFEWFQDQDGFRVCSPGRVAAATANTGSNYAASFGASCTSGSYYEVTAGVNWKPVKWLNIRPNVRYDWVDAIAVSGAGTQAAGPFGDNEDDQFIFSTDVNINF